MKNIYYPLIIKQFQLSIVHSVIMDTGLNVNMKEICAQDKDGGVLDYCQLHNITIQPWSILRHHGVKDHLLIILIIRN